MRISACVGNYAETPYCIPGLEIEVYCMEELCHCIKENAFLLDLSFLDDGLISWIESQCVLPELAGALHPLIHRQGSLSGFAVMIMEYTGFYDREVILEVEQILKQGAGLSSIEKRKSQVDYLVRKKKYAEALYGYDQLIKKWKEQKAEDETVLPAGSCLAAILHNKGAAYAGMMYYDMAAKFFQLAYEKDRRDDYYIDYLAAKRMTLSESEYVDLAAEKPEQYRFTLELERKIEQLSEDWEQQPEYLMLYKRREQRNGGDMKKYYEENERQVRLLKDGYRDSFGS